MDWIDFVVVLAKIGAVIGIALGSVPFMVLAERKIIAFAQNRYGPNRVGPWGILQPFVDGIKLLFKEDIMPAQVDRWLWRLAPLLTLAPALLLLAIVPFGPGIDISGRAIAVGLGDWSLKIPFASYFEIADRTITLGITQLNIGILYYFAITAVAVYGIILAGWSSNNKYSLLGGLRASAQMISYELPLGLSVIGVFLLAGTVNIQDIIGNQAGGFWNWHIMSQPAAFAIFLIAGFAETNRLPFDLPEGESELCGGFHTEYSSMRFAMFFMAEYANMIVFSALITVLFLGGYASPIPWAPEAGSIAAAAWGVLWFAAKIASFIVFFIWVRATEPRFRYDQLMDFGWKLLLPLALANAAWTALVLAVAPNAGRFPRTAALFVLGLAAIVVVDRIVTLARRRLLDATA
jgi:NADH-quinone oxidoreductase subunit H